MQATAHRFVIAVSSAVIIAAAAAARDTRAASTVPTPTVAGPIASSAVGDASKDYPFFASIVDLKAGGWVEEEFFIEGTANRYTIQGQATGAGADVPSLDGTGAFGWSLRQNMTRSAKLLSL